MQTFFCPSEILIGAGAISKLSEFSCLKTAKVLLVIDPFFAGGPLEERLRMLMKDCTIQVFSEIKPNPRDKEINEGAQLCRDLGAEVIVAGGGGSTIDTAKAINIVAANGKKAWDYTKGADRVPAQITEQLLPLIAVPTTAGTGTEATRYSVITNHETHEKATIKTDLIFPTKSIVDPEIMVTMPRMTTALTGIDAFSHCFEAFIGSKATPISEIFSRAGMKLFAENIRKACLNGEDLEAREAMALCCTLGGLSISHSATTLPHGIGQAFSGVTDAPHGASIAVCLPNVVRWTLPECTEKFAETARLFDPSVSGKTVEEQAALLPVILEDLFAEITGKKITMSDFGLLPDQVEKVADLALTHYNGDVSRHPKVADKAAIMELVKESM